MFHSAHQAFCPYQRKSNENSERLSATVRIDGFRKAIQLIPQPLTWMLEIANLTCAVLLDVLAIEALG
jgi:hypothetical protein